MSGQAWAVWLVSASMVFAACSSSAGDGNGSGGRAQAAPKPFSFGLWGDTPYTAAEDQAMPKLIHEMNGAGLAFSVNIGDITGARCDDQTIAKTIDNFDAFDAPLVYTPGDNEWTDCHGVGADPLQRLSYIRSKMFWSSRSFGKRTIELTKQSAAYPENARWRHGSVQFITVNVTGRESNNNHFANPYTSSQTPSRAAADLDAADAEYVARDQADRDWLHQGFAEAKRAGAAAVVVFMQADPAFSVAPAQREAKGLDGFDRLLDTFREETIAFGKPVLVCHGDSHILTIDQPLLDSGTGQPVANFYRAESYGSPLVGWIKVGVDVTQPKPFQFEPHLVPTGP